MEREESLERAASDLGVKCLWGQEILPNDLYLAERNTGPRLLTCHLVEDNYIVPVEMAYCYDVWECVKVK